MPSSPELWTATPIPIVSQTPAALMQGRMPPQNVVSSSTTSTARISTFAASCAKSTTTVFVAVGYRHELLEARELRHSPDGVFVVVVREVLDAATEIDRVGKRERAVRVVAVAVVGKRLGERAVARELVSRRKDAALELVHAKAVLLAQRARVRDELLGGAHLALS